LQPPITPRVENFIRPLFESNSFPFHEDKSIMEQFVTMKDELGWDATTFDRESQRLADLSVLQFNGQYGLNATKLTSWQALCRSARFDFIPDEIDVCKAVRHANSISLHQLTSRPSCYETMVWIYTTSSKQVSTEAV
jgi:hypothetical protein